MQIRATEYIDQVLSGSILVCRYVRLAVARHMRDLERERTDPAYPYYFDERSAAFVINFFQFLKHSKGDLRGQPIILEPWQQFILWSVFGWKRKADGTRRFRKVYEEVARKNGKSTMLAGVGLFGLVADAEGGAEIDAAAVDKDQAKEIWEVAKDMVDVSPDLRKIVSTFQSSIVVQSTLSKFIPLSKERKNKDGKNVHYGLIDEYHAHPNDEMYNVLDSGMASRSQPLLWVITTAGFDMASSCKRERDYAAHILEGTVENDTYFAIIYTLDENDDWTDERVWIKSNPNLGVSVKLEKLREQCHEAQGQPSKINEFKTKRMNLWCQTYTRWILPDVWAGNRRPVEAESLSGRSAVLAIDLSTTTDISGYCLCFPPEPGEQLYQLLWRFYIPEDGVRERSLREDVPYQAWIDAGFVTATEGNVIDYDRIEQDILKDAERYRVLEVPHDPYNATQLVNHLIDEGLPCVKFQQNIMNISPAAKTFERMVLSGGLAVGENPVMDYMIGCAEVWSDANGNIKVVKPDRRSSTKRIDGVIMAIMALHRAIELSGAGGSVYEERGVLAI